MAKQPPYELDLTRNIMAKMAAMPHKPHVAKKPASKKPKKAPKAG